MSNIHLMIDFETFGQDVRSCPIINCAYYAFDFDRFSSNKPYTFNELINDITVDKLSVKEQVSKYGYLIEESSLTFWDSLGPEVKKQIKPKSDDLKLEEFVDNFLNYLNGKKINRWWSRSNTFDPVILDRVINDVGRMDEFKMKLSPYKVRDIRTYVDAKFSFQNNTSNFVPHSDVDAWNKMFKPHISSHDVAADILRLQYITRIENDLE